MNERKDCEGKNGSWTAVIPPLLALLGLIVWIGCVGCDRVNAGERKRGGGFSYSVPGLSYEFKRIEGDGHLWLLGSSRYDVASVTITMLHHPDCACKEGK